MEEENFKVVLQYTRNVNPTSLLMDNKEEHYDTMEAWGRGGEKYYWSGDTLRNFLNVLILEKNCPINNIAQLICRNR